MGCAVVSLSSPACRQAILAAGEKIEVAGKTVTLKAHSDKETGEDFPSDLFVGWGRQVEKTSALSEQDLADYFDAATEQFNTTGRVVAQAVAVPATEEERRAQAMKTAAAQAQWAAGGAARAPLPPGPAGGTPGFPGTAQQQQAQYMQALQAQMMMRYQQQQQMYYQQVQAHQQQQQAAYMAQLKAQQEAAKAKKTGGHKASYRVPTDEELQATLQKLQKKPTSDADPASPEKPAPEAEAAPPTGVA